MSADEKWSKNDAIKHHFSTISDFVKPMTQKRNYMLEIAWQNIKNNFEASHTVNIDNFACMNFCESGKYGTSRGFRFAFLMLLTLYGMN